MKKQTKKQTEQKPVLSETPPDENEMKQIALKLLLAQFLGNHPVEVLNTGDVLLGVLDFEKQLYAIADFKRKITARGRLVRDGNGFMFKYKERVINAVPLDVVLHENEEDNVVKSLFEITFDSPAFREPRSIGPATINEIYNYLKDNGLVVNHNLARTVLTCLINSFLVAKSSTMR